LNRNIEHDKFERLNQVRTTALEDELQLYVGYRPGGVSGTQRRGREEDPEVARSPGEYDEMRV
jgi:hypothetical protein